jgi:acetyl esterase/lipase
MVKVNMKMYCLGLWAIFAISLANAQETDKRYKEEVFTEVKETKNIVFSTNVPQPTSGGGIYEFGVGKLWDKNVVINAKEHETVNRDLSMNIFEPVGDVVQQRPVIILCFGGAFAFGTKELDDMTILAKSFAKRGFVAVTIDYRIGINAFFRGMADRAIYRTVQDTRAAIRFLRASVDQQNPHKINPQHIYIGGFSSGGFAALHNVYLNKELERPASTYATSYRYGKSPHSKKWYDLPDLGCLDCTGDYPQYDGRANGAISMAGAIRSLDYIEGGSDLPCLLLHSKDDPAVPYGQGEPFSLGKIAAPTLAIGQTSGSSTIYEHAQKIGLNATLYSYEDRQHDVLFESGERTKVYPEVAPRIANFLYDLLSKKTQQNRVAVSLSAYPNPSPRVFHLSLGDVSITNIRVQVINEDKKLVYQGPLRKESDVFVLNLGSLPAGLYYLNVEANQQKYSLQLFKQ